MTGESVDWVPTMESLPIACTLPAAAVGGRAEAWRALLLRGLVACERRPGGLRLLVSPSVEPGIRDLLALEAECCAWLTSAVTAGDPVVVDLAAAGDGPAVLAAMIDAAIAPAGGS